MVKVMDFEEAFRLLFDGKLQYRMGEKYYPVNKPESLSAKEGKDLLTAFNNNQLYKEDV